MRITQRRRSMHDSKTRCAWHPRRASLGVPPTAERSGVVGVLIRILSNSQALTGCHASSPTRRGEACFALSGQSMAPACGSTAIRITQIMARRGRLRGIPVVTVNPSDQREFTAPVEGQSRHRPEGSCSVMPLNTAAAPR